MGKRVKILRETMRAAEDGRYFIGEQEVKLPVSFEQIKEVKLYSAEQIAQLLEAPVHECACSHTPRIALHNQDTLEAAFELHRKRQDTQKPVLVLNFAHPHRPGGGIRAIPRTQEEHLCVKTTVLCSLETEAAWPFYQTNLDCGTQAQTDTVLLSPHTMVIRDSELTLRPDPFPVAVMTVSAPIANRMEEAELPKLEAVLLKRIRGMIRVAMAEGYRYLILGAWGCGNFGNDADVVARLFHQALTERIGLDDCECAANFFEEITMAVFDRSGDQYQYLSFLHYFKDDTSGETH